MRIANNGRVKAGGVAVAAAAVLATITAPQAAASEPRASGSGSVLGYSSQIQFGPGAVEAWVDTCQDRITGPVTADDGHGRVEASLDDVTFDFCQNGIKMTPNALPWTLHLDSQGFTIDGFDVDVTTPQGTCRYSGPVSGPLQFPDGVYDLRGHVTRQSAGCGWAAELNVFAYSQVISH
jgi:hypothetical protein